MTKFDQDRLFPKSVLCASALSENIFQVMLVVKQELGASLRRDCADAHEDAKSRSRYQEQQRDCRNGGRDEERGDNHRGRGNDRHGKGHGHEH